MSMCDKYIYSINPNLIIIYTISQAYGNLGYKHIDCISIKNKKYIITIILFNNFCKYSESYLGMQRMANY